MKKVIIFLIFVLILSLSIIILSGCIENPQKEDNRLGIVVTILPQSEFAEKIGGDKVIVTVMVPPGASPHTYEPTPSQLMVVSNAKMYAKVGSGIEFERVWFDKIRETNKDMLVVDCSSGVNLINAEHGASEHEHDGSEHAGHYHESDNEFKHNSDPHIWLSPKNAKIMVENTYKGLIQIDPENKDYYKKNKDNYLLELDELDNEISDALSSVNNKKIMTYHPSWTYFAKDYGLEQIPIEKEGKEPTPQGISTLIKQAKENNITIIFASPQFSTKSAEVIAKELNGEVVLVDPLAKDYLNNLRVVAESIGGDEN